MKKYFVYLQKGGIGKSTLTAIMAYLFSKHGKTLIVDCDQQGHASNSFIRPALIADQPDFLSVLKEENSVKDAVINISEIPLLEKTKHYIANLTNKTLQDSLTVYLDKISKYPKDLHILRTKNGSMEFRSYMEGDFRLNPRRMKEIIAEIEEQGFKYVFFDLPPTYGFYEQELLQYADEIFPIVEPEPDAMKSLGDCGVNLTRHKRVYDGKYKLRYLIVNKRDARYSSHDLNLSILEKSPYGKNMIVLNKTSSIVNCSQQSLNPAYEIPKSDIVQSCQQLVDRLIAEENEEGEK